MNIGEANAANVVLRRLLESPTDGDAVDDRLVEAAVLLADQANKTLHAGLTGDQVRAVLS